MHKNITMFQYLFFYHINREVNEDVLEKQQRFKNKCLGQLIQPQK